MVTKASLLTMLAFALTLFTCGHITVDCTAPTSQDKPSDNSPDDFETRQTEKLLGSWTSPARMHISLQKAHYLSATASDAGGFIIRTTLMESREWLVRVL